MTNNVKKYRDFIVDKNYTIHAQGFAEPVVGKIVDIEVAEGNDALLVIKKNDGTIVHVFVRMIAGWTVDNLAA